MKKLHGTHSIQPLTITNSTIAEDAAIDESKINLSFSTASLNNTLNTVTQDISAHVNNNTNPHGQTLVQSVIQTEVIHSDNTDNTRTISVSNPGEGDVLLNVEGDISAINASFSGDTNIAGITTIGGQTHITGNVVIDGNLSVSGETTTVESNTIDYDSLLVTPSTALNRTGIIVAPDGTGFEPTGETTPSTIQVHDDLLYTDDGAISGVQELPNGDLVFSLYTRLVKTNSDITEIKEICEADEGEEFEYIALGSDGKLFVVTDNWDDDTVCITRLDSDLNVISKSEGMINPATGEAVSSEGIYSFDYLDGKFYIAIYESGLVAYFDEYVIDKATGSEVINTFTEPTSYATMNDLLVSNSEIGLGYVRPFYKKSTNEVYILAACTEGVYILDSDLNLASSNIITTGSNADQEFYRGTSLDTRNNRVIVSMGECIFFSFDMEPFLEPGADMMTANLTTTTVSSDFNDTSMYAYPIGFTGNSNILYYNFEESAFKWVDSSKFIRFEDIDQETEEVNEDVDTSVVVATRESADSHFRQQESTGPALQPPTIHEAKMLDAFSGADSVLYLSNDTGFLFSVDTSTNTILSTIYVNVMNNIPTGNSTIHGEAVSPDGLRYYKSVGQDFAKVTDLSTGNAVFPATVFTEGSVPNAITVRDNSGTLEEIYLAFNPTSNHSEIHIYDGNSRELLRTIDIAIDAYYGGIANPTCMIISSDNNWVYIGSLTSSTRYDIIAFDLRADTPIGNDSPYHKKLSYYHPAAAAGQLTEYIEALAVTSDGRIIAGTSNSNLLEIDETTGNIVSRVSLLEVLNVENMGLSSIAVVGDYAYVVCSYRPDYTTTSVYRVDIATSGNLANAEIIDFIEELPEEPVEPEEPGEPEEPEEEPGDLIRLHEVEGGSESVGDTFLGNLLELQKRTRGLNEAAVIVDKSGNLRLLTGGLEVGGIKGSVNNNTLTFDKGLGAASMITSNAGFIYKPSSDAQPGSKVLDIQDASGISNAFITKNGDATVNSLTIGVSSAITEVGTGLVISNDVNISSSELLLDDSTLTFGAENKNEWRALNRNSTISFYYDTQSTPQVELGDNLFDLSNCETTKTDDLIVMGDATFNGSVSMAANMTVDGIKVGSHDHTGGDMGTVLPQTAVTGLKTFVDNINTTIKNCVNEMTSGNTESGMNVAYNSSTGKLNFSVNDFTLTLSGDVQGSATVAHASNTTLSVTVKNSAKLGGLSLSSSTANTDANRVLRTDTNGKTTVKSLFISSPTAAGTSTLGNIYASIDGETEVKAYTPANFATQLLALGGTTKNSHTHTAVNGLTPIRGSSTFNGVSGRVIMLSTSRANTNYSVAVTPSAAPNGLLGEIWVVKGTDRFTVYNSGTATTAFDYIMLG